MASIDEKQKEEYYLRFHILVMEAQKVLRAKFDSIIKPADLTEKLNKAKRTLAKLNRNAYKELKKQNAAQKRRKFGGA
ncbi:hypothetical protein DPMN_134358 [Dreissena polymorpha]|uniref:Uncharacterized protein n=1 Tax=Dreissena polymorpha TaxID=45954 RepID=A0A9D4FW33_DREPO|nr:hypothetical protein DPMN_134358 [Dreissena polymorpha]